MFLRTLELKTDGRITEFIKAKLADRSIESNRTQGLMEDGRGKGVPSNKKDHASIQQYIESFNPQVSHYNLEHAPFRRYMDSDLTITAMWEDYKSKWV